MEVILPLNSVLNITGQVLLDRIQFNDKMAKQIFEAFEYIHRYSRIHGSK